MLSGRGIVDHGMRRNADVLAVVATSSYSDLAIEMIASYGMRVGKSVFETCVFIGELKATAEARGIPVRLVYRKDVKKFVCGTHLANDRDVRRAMVERYGESGTKSAPGQTFGITQDVWQALALATTALHDTV
jgi:Holliday junction resolvasome RuvABC endonuclease subunit